MLNAQTILDNVYDPVEKKLNVNAELEVSDLQIGAVEIKDATTGTRVQVVNNGTHDAFPILTDSRQEQVEVLAPVALGAGATSAAFDTLTEGYYSNRVFIEVSAATTIDIFYSASNSEFPATPFESVTFAGAGFEVALIDIPGWAKYAQVKTSGIATVTVDTFRSR